MRSHRHPIVLLIGRPGSLPVKLVPKLSAMSVRTLGAWPTTAGDMRLAGEAHVVVGEINAQSYADVEQLKRAFPASLVVTVCGQQMISAPLVDIHFNSQLSLDELAQVAKCLAKQTRPGRRPDTVERTGRIDEERRVGEWTVFPQQFYARHSNGEQLKLSQISIQILFLFLENPEISYSRTHLVLMFGRSEVKLKSRTIDQHLLAVRRILGRNQFRYLGYGSYTFLPEGTIPLSEATMRELARRKYTALQHGFPEK